MLCRFILKNHMKRLAIIISAVLACTAPLWAQQIKVSQIYGTVSDEAGAKISDVEIRLMSPQQIVVRAVRSDASGQYRIVDVAPGSYVLSASRPGFSSPAVRTRVSGDRSLAIDLVLEVNRLYENVTITAETGQAGDRFDASQQINIVSSDSIIQRTTGVMAQVADEETGVSLQRTSSTIGAVLVRGLTEVGVYVDGVRYTNSTQRGGINTFFNLNEPTAVGTVEIQRSPNTAQYGSDGLGGNLQLLSRQPLFGFDDSLWHGELQANLGSADRSFGGNALLGYGTKKYGFMGNIAARRFGNLRPGGGLDSHSAITRFLGLPSDIIGTDRLPDTGFKQYSGTLHFSFAPTEKDNISFRYQRSQQDGGKRYDQLLGGDGNLIADLKNLMLDFGYVRYYRQGLGFLDNFSATASFNSQREERINQGGQGNPLAAITNDKERTTTYGFSFYLDKRFERNHLLFGGDHYHDQVAAPSFNTDPATGNVGLVRPRVPNGSTYDLTGVYIQDIFEAVPDRLRMSGAVRYNIANYRSRASEAPIVAERPLFPDDSARFADVSGRIGAIVTIVKGFNTAFNYSRGFRAPNITSLGSLGLVGVGFQVSTTDVAGLGATIGSTADAAAVSTGVAVAPLRSETSNSYDLSFRYRNSRFYTNLTGFRIDYKDAIVRQTLILPQGAVGTQLGSQTITAQNANGAVFVPLSTSPVLVQTNFNNSRISGVEFEFDLRLSRDWFTKGNYSYVYAEDMANGEPPNLGGGGIPPQLAFFSIRYQPGVRFWVEAYANGAGRQSRLSSLDLADRRTGGSRTRNQIQNFFRRGACVRGITTVGSNGQCGTAGGTLIATGETLAQVQNRVLPIGAVINGVLVLNNDTAVPLFRSIPGYVLVNLRGGYRFNDKIEFTGEFENILDKGHRAPGWGIDGPGRAFTGRLKYSF
ncbi:MAG TPA: TonB-dependent receptor [Pyrinomonadaceae bacterium]|mgnify:CR=1 FL=1|nr:TonB-dependent receptor [Pyrinomonadaceae bacterium]